MSEILDNTKSVVETLGPLAGAIAILRLLFGFQRSIVDGAMSRTTALEEALHRAEQRIDSLEAEVVHCDLRNAQLTRALTLAGIEIPPPTTGA